MIQSLTDLTPAMTGSWYTILGAGDPEEYVKEYENILAGEGIGKPEAWYKVSGKEVNAFAGDGVADDDQFPEDLTILMFPLDGLSMGLLAMFKLQMQDRWFDDIVNNMRAYKTADSVWA